MKSRRSAKTFRRRMKQLENVSKRVDAKIALLEKIIEGISGSKNAAHDPRSRRHVHRG